jgi:hypothetical protein
MDTEMTRLGQPSQVVQLCFNSRVSNSESMFHDMQEEPIDRCDLLNAPKTKTNSHHCFFHTVWTECKRRDTPNSVQKVAPEAKEGL